MNQKFSYSVGKTRVNVFKVDDTGRTIKIQTGVIVKAGDKSLRVWNNNPVDRGGDASPQYAEWFAIDSPRIYIQPIEDLKSPLALPADL